MLEVGGVGAHLLHLFHAFRAGDHGHRARVLGPEPEVAGSELGRARDGDGPKLQEARQDDVPLRHLAEEDHHPVATAYSKLPRRIGEPVGEHGELGEVETALFAAGSEPHHGRPILCRPAVYHVAPEVEPLRRLPVEVRVRLLIVPYVGHDTSPFPKGSSPGQHSTRVTRGGMDPPRTSGMLECWQAEILSPVRHS